MIKLVFLLFGLAALVGMVWHAGPHSILATIQHLGPGPLCIIMLPIMGVYALEAYGWQLTLGPPHAHQVGYIRLFVIRMAGEVINATTPTGYLGGEPLKAYFLGRYGVPIVQGMASVVTAKTTMTLAQIIFILLGLGGMFWALGVHQQSVVTALVSLGLLSFGLMLFFLVQKYGMAFGLLSLLRKFRLHINFFETREAQLLELDQTIRNFYGERRRTFGWAIGAYLLGWITETLEVYAILYFLDVPVDWISSFSIAALSVLIKGGTFFIPGSVGAQEGGYLLLLMGFGYDQVTGITFALIRRLREVLWIMIGLIFLAMLHGQKSTVSELE